MKKKESIFRYVSITLLLLLLIVGFFINSDNESKKEVKNINYNEFLAKVEKDEVTKVIIDYNLSKFTAENKKGEQFVTDNPRTKNFKEFLLKENIKVEEYKTPEGINFFSLFTLLLLGFLAYSIVSTRKNSPLGKSGTKKMSEPKKNPKVQFNDIAGNEGVKNDVQFIVDFLKNPKKYEEMGARMPKGTIFYGPPGTGKTLLAKAIAGEAGVPFFSVSGSDFVEMFVGVGARRVRDLFAEARKKAPCIIFIDEMDAVGKKRGQHNSGEKDQTLLALLTELDGFSSSEGIVVIGATNDLESLDSALIRPGRFDKHIAIPLPELKERKEILKLHSKNKKFANNVDFESLSKLTIGFSGAGLETLMNESAIIAVGKGKQIIDNEDVDDAFYKVVMKGNKKSTEDINKNQLELVAWHEAGHALVSKLLTKKSVPKVTIIPSTNGAGGVTFIIPEKAGLHTKADLTHEIQTLYAGRIAEFLLRNDESLITTGASQDIKQATKIIFSMIKELGMTEEFGMLYVQDLSAFTDEVVLEEAKKISKEMYNKTFELMKDKKDLLEKVALALLEKETIEEAELDSILFGKNQTEVA